MRGSFPTNAIAFSFIAAFILSASIASPQAIVPDPASIAPVINPPNPQTNIVLSLADFMTDQNGQPVSTYQAFKRALDACRQQKAAKLIIPTGTYVFDDPQILQDGGHIGLYNLSDLVIDGQGSSFLFHYPLLLASLGTAKKEANGTTSIHILAGYPVAAGTPFQLIAPYDISHLQWRRTCCELNSPQNVTMISPQVFVSPDFNSLEDGEEVIVQHYRYE